MESWVLFLQLVTGRIGVLDMPSKEACTTAVESINTPRRGALPFLRLHSGEGILVVRALYCLPALDEVPAS